MQEALRVVNVNCGAELVAMDSLVCDFQDEDGCEFIERSNNMYFSWSTVQASSLLGSEDIGGSLQGGHTALGRSIEVKKCKGKL